MEFANFVNKIICGDALEVLKQMPDEFVDCIVTSPPYWGLRDYGVEGQIGLEETPEEYVDRLVKVFREARRVLKKEGTLWLNLGDTYMSHRANSKNVGSFQGRQIHNNIDYCDSIVIGKKVSPKAIGLKDKDLVGIPWMVAFALRADGWYLRQDIIWAKRNSLPESVKDRCTKSHEYIFLMSKSPRYYFDSEAIKEPKAESSFIRVKYPRFSPNSKGSTGKYAVVGSDYSDTEKNSINRNKRSVWWVSTKPFKDAHFAVFPEDLVEPMILAGCPEGGIVLDPFMGSGTTAVVAKRLGRKYIGIELNPKYIEIAEKRIKSLPEYLF